MAETAFCCVWRHDECPRLSPERTLLNSQPSDAGRHGDVGLWRQTASKGARNPARGSELLQLYSECKGTEPRINETDAHFRYVTLSHTTLLRPHLSIRAMPTSTMVGSGSERLTSTIPASPTLIDASMAT